MRKKCTECDYVYTGEREVKFCSMCGSPMEELVLSETPALEFTFFHGIKLDIMYGDIQVEFNNQGRTTVLIEGPEEVKQTVRVDGNTISAEIPGVEIYRSRNEIRKYRGEYYINDEKPDPEKKLKIKLSLPWIAELDLGQFTFGDVTMVGNGGGMTLHSAGYMNIMGGVFDTVDYKLSGSGAWVLETVKYDLKATISGAGSFEANGAGNTSIQLTGNGKAEIESVIGNLKIGISGSGNVTVNGGAVDELSVNISGAGNVELDLTAITGEFNISGVGNISVNECLKVRSRKVSGVGTISIG